MFARFWYFEKMETAGQHTPRTIDVTGLPDTAVQADQAIIDVLRQQATTPPSPAGRQDWTVQFDAWMREVALRANRYPPGFVVDDRRDTIYEGCGK
jgi:hypothetical protein